VFSVLKSLLRRKTLLRGIEGASATGGLAPAHVTGVTQRLEKLALHNCGMILEFASIIITVSPCLRVPASASIIPLFSNAEKIISLRILHTLTRLVVSFTNAEIPINVVTKITAKFIELMITIL
jgi:hypothetical protein